MCPPESYGYSITVPNNIGKRGMEVEKMIGKRCAPSSSSEPCQRRFLPAPHLISEWVEIFRAPRRRSVYGVSVV